MSYESFDHLRPEDRKQANLLEGGLLPSTLTPQIEEMNKWIQSDINARVHDVGSALDQETYDRHIGVLLQALDRLESILGEHGHGKFLSGHGKRRFLLGEIITEIVIRLFTTVRFDVAYNNALKCSRKQIRHDYPNLHR
ncbi:hypothetical protein B0J14DRAFT_680827 [Halenospora varia]|nr:hypothetical protein B0J14DRAFT_680827 [Halenospora varia]